MFRAFLPAIVAAWWCLFGSSYAQAFRAGASAIDVTPMKFPVIQNGGFLERQIHLATEKLYARCLALDDGQTRMAIVVVDSCMIPRTLCDEAKALAYEKTGLPPDKILIAATHTHSAPSVMDHCLGSRADPDFTEFLPPKIAEAIVTAVDSLEPAKVAWSQVDAGAFTHCRRWITRHDSLLEDPFGQRTVHAMMHPGHENAQYVGPSGPKDPWLTFLSVRRTNGEPLALFGHFAMHYFGGHAGASADYFGHFVKQVKERLAPDSKDFVGILSQGTSGDIWRADYGEPKEDVSIEGYTKGLVDLVMEAHKELAFEADVDLAMAEKRIMLGRRLPNGERLTWARRLLGEMGDRRPQNRPEVYAEQAIFIHENPQEEVVLQAVRVGELAFAAMPNEVYALTGLKVRARSPISGTSTIELANGAAGYIPPPEQHALGGYTTWPARTAGLEVEAEPKIVDGVLALLEEVSGKPRRVEEEETSAYAKEVLSLKPYLYWRLGEMDYGQARDASGNERHGKHHGLLAMHLPGVDGVSFGGKYASHATHFAEGRIASSMNELPNGYTAIVWVWRGVASHGRLFQLADSLSIDADGHLILGDFKSDQLIPLKHWIPVTLVHQDQEVQAYVNGEPVVSGTLSGNPQPNELALGGPGFQGKLDEFAFFDRALTKAEIDALHRIARPQPDSPALSPEASLEQCRVDRGLQIELVAAEPLVRDPVAIDWGPDGKLWVTEMADYPYGMDGQGKPGGRVRYLTDSDDDGRYDTSTVFLDGLNFPTSAMPWRGGVLVTAAPEIFYAEDRDDDGRADYREALFEGFMEGNQQLRVNCLRWGLDNHVYAASGGHHAGFGAKNVIRSVKTGAEIPLGSRDLRMRPDEGWLEPASGPSQFGRVRDDWGNWFGVQNSFPLWHYVLPDRYLARNPHVPAPDPRKQLRGTNPQVYQIKAQQKRYHSFEQAGRFTSACGPCIYRDDFLYPREEGLTHAFTCEPFHNVVQHHHLRDDGVSFQGQCAPLDDNRDFFASADRWCRPVMARTGPDGALWIVDMYRYMIEHPDWLPEEGREELKPFYRFGENRGRIYRVFPKGKSPKPIKTLRDRPTKELVEGLTDSNGWVRDTSQRLMVERQEQDAVPFLKEFLSQPSKSYVRLQALATLSGLDAVEEETLLLACEDSHAAVRRWALRLIEDWDDAPFLERLLVKRGVDPNHKVRLQTALTLGELPGRVAGRALPVIMRALHHPDLDRFMAAAILSSAEAHFDMIVEDVQFKRAWRNEVFEGLLAMGVARGSMEEIWRGVLKLAENDPARFQLTGTALRLMKEAGENVSAIGEAPVRAEIDRLIMKARSLIADPALAAPLRKAAMSVCGYSEDKDQESEVLMKCVRVTEEETIVLAAIAALVRMEKWALLLKNWSSYLPNVRVKILEECFKHQSGVTAMMAALESELIQPMDLGANHKQRLLKHRNVAISDKAKLLIGRSPSSREEIMAARKPALQLKGEASKGREAFEQICSACHQLGGLGKNIGPDLRSLTNHTAEALFAAIIDPNRAVDPRHLAYTVTLKDSTTLFGMLGSETGNSLGVKALDGTETTVLKNQIVSLNSTQASFMPEGLDEGLTDQQLADLIAFVQKETEKPDAP